MRPPAFHFDRNGSPMISQNLPFAKKGRKPEHQRLECRRGDSKREQETDDGPEMSDSLARIQK